MTGVTVFSEPQRTPLPASRVLLTTKTLGYASKRTQRSTLRGIVLSYDRPGVELAYAEVRSGLSCPLQAGMAMNQSLTIVLPLIAGLLAAQGYWCQSKRIGPVDIHPDPARTPGAANPQVTQQNIKDTICNPHWSTKLVRPPA